MHTVSEIWLPQIKEENVNEILQELKDSGIIVKSVMVEPSYLKPLQKKVSKTKIDEINTVVDNDGYLPRTWVDANNNILDGHHRVYAYQSRPDIDKVECFKIFLNSKDACRILNKIQDRLDFKKEYGIKSPSTFNMMDTIQNELNNVTQPQQQAQYFGPDKEQEVVSLIGDGGFSMNIQELQVLKNYNIGIKVFILKKHIHIIKIMDKLFKAK
jgi:hypothetical protein